MDATYEAQRALDCWDVCLELLGQPAAAREDHPEPQPPQPGVTCFNRYPCLIRSQRLDEAQGVLGACLEVFREGGESLAVASALAELDRPLVDIRVARFSSVERQGLRALCPAGAEPHSSALGRASLTRRAGPANGPVVRSEVAFLILFSTIASQAGHVVESWPWGERELTLRAGSSAWAVGSTSRTARAVHDTATGDRRPFGPPFQICRTSDRELLAAA